MTIIKIKLLFYEKIKIKNEKTSYTRRKEFTNHMSDTGFASRKKFLKILETKWTWKKSLLLNSSHDADTCWLSRCSRPCWRPASIPSPMLLLWHKTEQLPVACICMSCPRAFFFFFFWPPKTALTLAGQSGSTRKSTAPGERPSYWQMLLHKYSSSFTHQRNHSEAMFSAGPLSSSLELILLTHNTW